MNFWKRCVLTTSAVAIIALVISGVAGAVGAITGGLVGFLVFRRKRR